MALFGCRHRDPHLAVAHIDGELVEHSTFESAPGHPFDAEASSLEGELVERCLVADGIEHKDGVTGAVHDDVTCDGNADGLHGALPNIDFGDDSQCPHATTVHAEDLFGPQ